MATCENDHEPITFEGEFRALCPLCAMRERLTDEWEEDVTRAKTEAVQAVDEMYKEMGRANVAEEKLDKMEEERDGWENRAKELQAELDSK